MLAVCVPCVGIALGAVSQPAFILNSFAVPTSFSNSHNTQCVESFGDETLLCDAYQVTVTNSGSMATSGPIVLSDVLPGEGAGESAVLSVQRVDLFASASSNANLGTSDCAVKPVRCEYTPVLSPDEALRMVVYFTVKASTPPGGVKNRATVSGGGAATVSASSENLISGSAPTFGFSVFDAPLVGLSGLQETQAGGHPYELSTVLGFNNMYEVNGNNFSPSVEDPRDVIVDLPVGVVGSALSTPRLCTFGQLSAEDLNPGSSAHCPAESIIGHIKSQPEGSISRVESPLYNMVPEHGVAAEFGFVDGVQGTHALYASLVPTPAGYVLRTTSPELPQSQLDEVTAHVFGDPATRDGAGAGGAPTFTSPEACGGEPLVTRVYSDSWEHPGSYNADGTPDLSDPNWVSATSTAPAVTGCNELQGLFDPSIVASPDTTRADSPTGLSVDVAVPQQEGADKPGTPPLRDAVVTLPEGMSVNPSSANGLGACSESQVGVSGTGVPTAAPPMCPNSSKIGTVELETPTLPSEHCKEPVKALQAKTLEECPDASEREKTPLEGAIYLAKQDENPFGSLLAIYIVINDPRTGVVVKLAGEVKANGTTGQLTTVVSNSPQFPFSELRTHFFGGNTASLSTPASCGSYSVSSQLTPWSAPQSGPPATPSSPLQVTEAADGGPCETPFSPAFSAGSTSPQAGGFSSFSLSFSRQDGEQTIGGVSVTTPPGLLGIIKNVTRCPEPQASKGECGPESLIGEATTAVGAGPEPYWVHGGDVYLTGPYNNGPFGLTIVVPTTAGPFTLIGNGGAGREIIRSSIRVNPTTSQITVLSDPLPTIIQGIPLHIKTVDVTINRPRFMINPTNCNPLSVGATITSTSHSTSSLAVPYYAANCAALPFHPALQASAKGQASKQNGASLTIKVTAKPGQANIAKTDLTLPVQLPTRQSTLKTACVAATFEANPAACDPRSVIGTATVHTPILAASLAGPAYLVSHGGAEFPDVEFVLQGEGITLDLDGKTKITKGLTYSRFETVPDAPIETFETSLPTGPHSILTTNLPKNSYNLCGQKLTIPTSITGQNGATVTQDTKLTITNCLTPKQQLAKALKACKRDSRRAKRLACEKAARKKYSTAAKTKTSTKRKTNAKTKAKTKASK
jgi:hypothetical protein